MSYQGSVNWAKLPQNHRTSNRPAETQAPVGTQYDEEFCMPNQNLFDAIEHYQSFAPGHVIFREGELGSSMYIVADGQVDIMLSGGRVLETVSSGGILGELALIDDKPRSASAIAKTECLLAPVNREHFLALVQRTPLFALQVMRALAERLRRANSQLGY
ncbi:MAG TPA: cyclic nucleotide-binding domain-containing protein [Candidatus Competibacter sp.]|jgi:CRP-like cAMP-binding protein|nr:cyclic nucleotide-binding domain-containing protein [Candidatus Competibacter sp.]HUM90022.1 cyclic nucleotide-binding domain-containing protein [Candidatus Competibacter sp.]